ncbi:MAG: hypothetical protein WBC04_22410 [Candidatus Acidiferrales bacterium]
MRKFYLIAGGALTFAAFLWAAGDPWREKPYQQWDQKDITRILTDSPWSKVVRVDAPWRTSGQRDDDEGESDEGPQAPSGGGMSRGGYGAGGGSQPPGGASGGGPSVPQAAFVVRWASSQTIREAVYRDAVLKGQMKQEDVDKALLQPVGDYDVLVVGKDMSQFAKSDENALKGQAYLSTKKTKQKISPGRVQIQKSQDGMNIVALIFSFPKKTSNGENDIAPDEKGVEFVLAAGQVKLKAGFDPSKMANQQGRDL